MTKFSFKIIRDWDSASVGMSSSLGHTISNLNDSGLKVCLVVNGDNTIVGVISDGDVRRALISGATLEANVLDHMETNPITVPEGISEAEIEKTMLANKVFQIPVVDNLNHVQAIYIWDGIAPHKKKSTRFIIMAGGKGVRMRPHTENCPKPMLPINGKPMLEQLINKAKAEGIENFVISINYLGHIIEEHFGNGAKFGVNISYIRETEPLGTAGSLSLVGQIPKEPTIVVNGDLVSQIKYDGILDFHIEHCSAATMAVKAYEMQNPFGVVKLDALQIVGFEEKPVSRSYINAGIYVLSPEAFSFLEYGKHCDMPTLFERLNLAGLKTLAYPMHENWTDVGRPSDLVALNSQIQNP